VSEDAVSKLWKNCSASGRKVTVRRFCKPESTQCGTRQLVKFFEVVGSGDDDIGACTELYSPLSFLLANDVK